MLTQSVHFNANLPLPDLLGAFAGAALILSFIPPKLNADGTPQTRTMADTRRTFATIAFCTLGATWLGPLAGDWLGISAQFSIGTAFATAAVAQMMIPVLIDKRTAIADWLLGLLPGRKPPAAPGGGA